MKKFFICSHKGGCGKTITAINLAAVASQNHQVLFVDASFTNTAESLLLSQKSKDKKTLQTMLVEGIGIFYYDLLPNFDFIAISSAVVRKGNKMNALHSLLNRPDKLPKSYDHIVIDAGSIAKPYLQFLMDSCDHYAWVMNPEPMAYRSLSSGLKIIHAIEEEGIECLMHGIILNSRNNCSSNLSWIESMQVRFGEVIMPVTIPYSPSVEYSSLKSKALVTAYPDTDISSQYHLLARTLGIA